MQRLHFLNPFYLRKLKLGHLCLLYLYDLLSFLIRFRLEKNEFYQLNLQQKLFPEKYEFKIFFQ
jgi:hypothetical protein